MILNKEGFDFIKDGEALRLEAYKDSKGICTIGYGTTRYPDGTAVTLGDRCTEDQADSYIMHHVNMIEKSLLLPAGLTQNQFNAIVSLCYNIGVPAFHKSTLYKFIRDTSDVRNNKGLISSGFYMWVKITVNGKKKTLPGLVNRRKKEIQLYFTV